MNYQDKKIDEELPWFCYYRGNENMYSSFEATCPTIFTCRSGKGSAITFSPKALFTGLKSVKRKPDHPKIIDQGQCSNDLPIEWQPLQGTTDTVVLVHENNTSGQCIWIQIFFSMSDILPVKKKIPIGVKCSRLRPYILKHFIVDNWYTKHFWDDACTMARRPKKTTKTAINIHELWLTFMTLPNIDNKLHYQR